MNKADALRVAIRAVRVAKREKNALLGRAQSRQAQEMFAAGVREYVDAERLLSQMLDEEEAES